MYEPSVYPTSVDTSTSWTLQNLMVTENVGSKSRLGCREIELSLLKLEAFVVY